MKPQRPLPPGPHGEEGLGYYSWTETAPPGGKLELHWIDSDMWEMDHLEDFSKAIALAMMGSMEMEKIKAQWRQERENRNKQSPT